MKAIFVAPLTYRKKGNHTTAIVVEFGLVTL
jgi:hypothetical protein